MSPTHWTASRIKQAAREHGWEIIPAPAPDLWPWKIRKDFPNERLTIKIMERRDGGLNWVCLIRGRPEVHLDSVFLDSRFANKRDVVLSWLTEPIDWKQWGISP